MTGAGEAPVCAAGLFGFFYELGELFFDCSDAVSWFAPKFLVAMVAVLHNESAFVDGFVHHVASGVPLGQV